MKFNKYILKIISLILVFTIVFSFIGVSFSIEGSTVKVSFKGNNAYAAATATPRPTPTPTPRPTSTPTPRPTSTPTPRPTSTPTPAITWVYGGYQVAHPHEIYEYKYINGVKASPVEYRYTGTYKDKSYFPSCVICNPPTPTPTPTPAPTPTPIPIPAVPSNVTASATAGTVTVSWSSVAGATQYVVSLSGDHKTTTGTSFSYTWAAPGTTYGYNVQAVNSSGSSSFSTAKNITTNPATYPGSITATATDTSITITWSSVSEADSYEASVIGDIRGTTSNSIMYNGLTPDTEYGYSVHTIINGVSSTWASSQHIKTLPKPKVTLQYKVGGTIVKSWGEFLPFSGAWPAAINDSFQPDSNGKYKYVSSDNAGGMTLNLTSSDNGRTYTATFVDQTPIVPTNVTASATAKTATISWSPVAGATQYVVNLIGDHRTTTGTSYTFTGLTPGTTYGYNVQAQNSYGSSSFSTAQSFTTNTVNSPAVFSATATDTSITITWSSVSEADSYEASVTGDIRSTTSNSIMYNGLTPDTEYGYSVHTIINGVSSTWAPSQHIKTLPKPKVTLQYKVGGTIVKSWGEFLPFTGTWPTYINDSFQYDANGKYKYVSSDNAGGMTLNLSSSDNGRTYTATFVDQTPIVPTNVTASATAKTATISWSPVAGATQYVVNLIGDHRTTTGTSYTFAGLTPGTTYSYNVQAQNSYGSSSFSTAQSFTTNTVNAPTVFSATATDTGITITWSSVSEADSYEASVAGDVRGTTATSITYNGFTPDTDYGYSVHTIINGVSSTWPASQHIRTLPKPKVTLQYKVGGTIVKSWGEFLPFTGAWPTYINDNYQPDVNGRYKYVSSDNTGGMTLNLTLSDNDEIYTATFEIQNSDEIILDGSVYSSDAQQYQHWLNVGGFTDYDGCILDEDGYFGERSKSALDKFLVANGFSYFGIAARNKLSEEGIDNPPVAPTLTISHDNIAEFSMLSVYRAGEVLTMHAVSADADIIHITVKNSDTNTEVFDQDVNDQDLTFSTTVLGNYIVTAKAYKSGATLSSETTKNISIISEADMEDALWNGKLTTDIYGHTTLSDSLDDLAEEFGASVDYEDGYALVTSNDGYQIGYDEANSLHISPTSGKIYVDANQFETDFENHNSYPASYFEDLSYDTTFSQVEATYCTVSNRPNNYNNLFRYSKYTGNSITTYLQSIGVDSSAANRVKIAKYIGIGNYSSTDTDKNTQMLNKLRSIAQNGTGVYKAQRQLPFFLVGLDVVFNGLFGSKTIWQYIGSDANKIRNDHDYYNGNVYKAIHFIIGETAEEKRLRKNNEIMYNRISANDNQNFTAEQLALMFLYDTNGVKDYLTEKHNQGNNSLENSIFKILTNNKKVLYASSANGAWVNYSDLFATTFTQADALLTYVVPPVNLKEIVTFGVMGITALAGVGVLVGIAAEIADLGYTAYLGLQYYGILGSSIVAIGEATENELIAEQNIIEAALEEIQVATPTGAQAIIGELPQVLSELGGATGAELQVEAQAIETELEKIGVAETQAEVSLIKSELETEIGIIAGDRPQGAVFDGKIYRSVTTGTNPLEIHSGNINADYRYTEEGIGGLYFSTNENTVNEELRNWNVPIEGRVMYNYDVNINKLLDVSNPQVRIRLGVTLDQIVGEDYEVTHWIGRLARECGYNGIVAPSARADGALNIILFDGGLVG
jgi:chitodextrinase